MIKTVKYLHDTKNIKVYVNNVNQHKITNKMNITTMTVGNSSCYAFVSRDMITTHGSGTGLNKIRKMVNRR